MKRLLILVTVVLGLSLAASAREQMTQASADIRRTSYGVPHIRASDERGLGVGMGYAYAQDNLVLFSWAKENPGYRVLPEKLGSEDPIAPAVKKGNIELRDWVNDRLAKLGEEKYLLKLYDQYVRDKLSADTDPNDVIVEGGKWQG